MQPSIQASAMYPQPKADEHVPAKPTHKPVKADFEALATFTRTATPPKTTPAPPSPTSSSAVAPPTAGTSSEYQYKGTNKKPLRADGALVDDLTLVHGLWSQGRKRRPHQRDHP